MPSLKARIRFYPRDEDGCLQFMGKNVIDRTKEKISVYAGNAFDFIPESCSFSRRNAVQLAPEYAEHLSRGQCRNQNRQIVGLSDPFRPVNTNLIAFAGKMKAGEI